MLWPMSVLFVCLFVCLLVCLAQLTALALEFDLDGPVGVAGGALQVAQRGVVAAVDAAQRPRSGAVAVVGTPCAVSICIAHQKFSGR